MHDPARPDAIGPSQQGRLQPIVIDALIADLAARQHGVVARRQLLAMGIDGNSIDARIRSGLLQRVRPGVYRVGAPLTRRGRWMGDVLACGTRSGLGATTALQLLGAMKENRRRTVVITSTRGRRPIAGIDLRTSREVGFVTVDGIPTTPLPRALADAAAMLDDEQLEAAYERAVVNCDLDPTSIPPRNRRLNEIVHAHQLGTALTDSELENLFRRIIKRSGLPQPASNQGVWTGTRWYRPDFLWTERSIIVEILGWNVHRGQREADSRRTADLLALGYIVIEFTEFQLLRRPHEIAAALRPFL